MVLDRRSRRAAAAVERQGVLIALGGGDHVHQWGARLAEAILTRQPSLTIRIIEGFSHTAQGGHDPRITWVSAPNGLATELRAAAVAVVAGGLTLYEAAALGAPAVALAVVSAQQPTIRGFARREAAVDAGLATDPMATHAAGGGRPGPIRPAAAEHCTPGRGRAADAIQQLARRFETNSMLRIHRRFVDLDDTPIHCRFMLRGGLRHAFPRCRRRQAFALVSACAPSAERRHPAVRPEAARSRARRSRSQTEESSPRLGNWAW
jgi:hypothetical protein